MAKIFDEMLPARWAAGARICVGLDSDYKRLPTHLRDNAGGIGQQYAFNKAIIDETHPSALAYKLNIAFYAHATMDAAAREILLRTIEYIRRAAPLVPVILDSKRADIGTTNLGYLEEIAHFKPDAVTVNPYFGMDAMLPFLQLRDVGMFALCRTSNKGAEKIQELLTLPRFEEARRWGLRPSEHMPLYQQVAWQVARDWNTVSGNCALVVGGTTPQQLGSVRRIVGNAMWILVPGIGTQGGDLEGTLQEGLTREGSGLVINSSSGIIFAGGGSTFAEAAQEALFQLTGKVNAVLATRTLV